MIPTGCGHWPLQPLRLDEGRIMLPAGAGIAAVTWVSVQAGEGLSVQLEVRALG